MGKRQEIKNRLKQKQRKQRMTLLLIVGIFALVISAIIIFQSLKPIGEIKSLPVQNRPQTEGLTMGDPAAKIVVEVFSDFQCVACTRFWETMEPDFISRYVETGDVLFKYVPFNFIGPESFQAAEAALCANEQNRFWDYHDMLFLNWTGENIGNFSDRRLVAFAADLGLQENEFKTCLDSNRYNNSVQESLNYGRKVGVTGTPSFLVNGKLVGADTLFAEIDSLLSK